ncbi:MAG: hypothetical protein AABX16_05505 [Nanoarchaeota archaeon]
MIFGGILVLAAVSWTLYFNNFKMTEKEKKLGKEFIIPSKLETKLIDLDNDNQTETVITYKNKSWLFKEDETGKPAATPYSVIPQQIVPQYGGK